MAKKKGVEHPVDCDCDFCQFLLEEEVKESIAESAAELRRRSYRESARRVRARARGEDVPRVIAKRVPIEHTCDGSNKRSCGCRVVRNRERTTTEMNRRATLRQYGLTLAEFQQLLVAQDYRCAVCGRHEEEVRWGPELRGLVVDHCHVEGHVRGLLCNGCNRGMGYFADNPEQLRAAAAYLERTQSSTYVPGLELAFPTGAGQALGEAVSSRDGTG